MPGTTTAGALRRVPLFSKLSEEQLAWISNRGLEAHLVPEEIKQRIFEPFFTTKEVGSGIGHVLDIVRRAVEEHDEEIRTVSKPGETKMEVRLPVGASV